MLDGLLPGVDRDLVRPLAKRLQNLFEAIHLRSRVGGVRETDGGLEVELELPDRTVSLVYDQVLVAVGRRPNSEGLGLENTGARVDAQGFIRTDSQCRTDDPAIFAIGDVAGQPMLAHKATREAKVAAEVIAGEESGYEPEAIPAVVFTDPEVAWCGLTEGEARNEGQDIQVVRFPWAASGRALTMGRPEGLTKMILDPDRDRSWASASWALTPGSSSRRGWRPSRWRPWPRIWRSAFMPIPPFPRPWARRRSRSWASPPTCTVRREGGGGGECRRAVGTMASGAWKGDGPIGA